MRIPAEKVVALESGLPLGTPRDDSFRVELTSGDALIGRIEDGSADDLRLQSPAFGDATISLDDVTAIWNLAYPRPPESLPPPLGDAETLYVDQDGRVDHTPGRLERVGKGQIAFATKPGEPRVYSFARDRVIAVRFGAAESRPSKGAASIVTLQDGSRLTGTLRPSDGAHLAIKLVVGPELVVDSRRLKSLAIVNDALRYLSDVEPARFTETPLFEGALVQGLQRDRGLKSGQPLRAGRQTFTKGLLVPARGRAVYALDGKFRKFTAAVGADATDGGGDLAGSVRATVLVDGKPAWKSGILRVGQSPEAVEVAVEGSKELAIEVDFGDSFDAGARAVFGNAMLIR
jgi:hypothetical protein